MPTADEAAESEAACAEPTETDPLPCKDGLPLETLGAATWRYLGPAHSIDGELSEAGLSAVLDELPLDVPDTGAANLGSSILVTDEGYWVVESVDTALAEQTLDEVYDRHRFIEDRDSPLDMIDEGLVDVQHTGWRAWNLPGTQNPFCPSTHVWAALNGDNRVQVNAPYNDRQSAMVVLDTVNVGGCSGVMLDEEWLLTAAHCVSDNSAVCEPVADITVKLKASLQDRSASACLIPVAPHDAYTKRDVALVKISSPFTASHGTMILSDAADVTLEAEKSIILGFPSKKKVTTTCAASLGAMFRSPAAQVDNVTTDSIGMGVVKTDNDNSGGQSGGPVYYCPANPNNSCAGGDATYVFGTVSGITVTSSSSGDTVSAKVPGFVHDWAHVIEPTLP